MLGSLIPKKAWRWAAVGKHPAATDYIQLDDGSALIQAVTEWMTKGYDHIQRQGYNTAGNHSWRFWLRGVKRGNLIAGVIRDSSDRIGRPFPLLIMGEGNLRGWEERWERLPVALNKLWQRAEYIGAHPYDSLEALSAELKTLNSPDADTMNGGDPFQGTSGGETFPEFAVCADALRRDGKVLIPLSSNDGGDSVQVSVGWHTRLRACMADLPRAVFLGGSPQQTYLAALQLALGSSDFEMLWSV